ncbi:MAG: sulfatase-like hydrolase/transferase [Planctomycetes bacterium]|nr:sulfatase-like hydrolase/transferase [Planctomycetota bacterium]
MSEQPNVLFIFTDMQRADTIHALGNPHIKTPNLDRIVKEGSAFTNCYTPSPVCVAARCSLQYGLYPHRTGCAENTPMIEDTDNSFVHHLGEAGYRTHAIGKCHFEPDGHAMRGFQSRESQEEIAAGPEEDDYLKYLIDQGHEHIIDPHGMRGEMYYTPQIAQMPAKDHPTQWIGDRSIDFMNEQKSSDQPWYLFSSIIHPHPPFAVPSPWHKLYREPDMPLPLVPEDLESLYTYVNYVQNRYKYHDHGIDNHQLRLIKVYYYACISFIDFQVGRMLDTLEANGQLENTLILFSSDHGEHLGDYHCFGKRSMHATSSRVPMLARLPGKIPANKIITQATSLVDIAPTCLSLAGVPDAASDMDGESLIDIANDKSERKFVFSQCGKGDQAQYLIANNYQNFFYSAADDKEFYFDHRIDSLETRNRAYTIGAGQEEASVLSQELLIFLKKHNLDYAYEESASGILTWKKHPAPSGNRKDADAGLLRQDHPWADQHIPGYSD